MDNQIIRISWPGSSTEAEDLLEREWLVTNGLGGYASGTLVGVPTRRYHGLLTGVLPAPLGRHMMFNQLTELVRVPGGANYLLGGAEWARAGLELHGAEHLREFRLEAGLPVWRYEVGGIAFEKYLFMPHMQNSIYIGYRLVAGEGPLRLKLRVAIHFRPHDSSPLSGGLPVEGYTLRAFGDRYEIKAPGLPPLRLRLNGQRSAFTVEAHRFTDMFYRAEEARGYAGQGDLWSPGYFRVDLAVDREVSLVASSESWKTLLALDSAEVFAAALERRQHLIAAAQEVVRTGPASQLVLAADQFPVAPAERPGESARLHAAGIEARTVIAGYHWFTDWGRDTMISLEGLTLITGRYAEAGSILRTFARHVREGLIPNLFPEGQSEGVYHTADATLWFFHALDRYVEATGDRVLLRELLPKLVDIIEHHITGTRFGIRADPEDGLLLQGDPHLPLTWMDAKMEDWVITPRRGKAVEINALWYNALRLLARWLSEEGQDRSEEFTALSQRARGSFNRRFWNAEASQLYDVVDGENGDDPACRPNQLFAISLPNPVLDQARWLPVVEAVHTRLLTPVGIRTLSADHPDYKPNYHGDLRSRDAAYHQGTVWPWLIGAFVDAWIRVYPGERTNARRFLERLVDSHLREACIGSISEIFDAEEPFTPRGCIAQAWSVAELLRCWVRTAEDDGAER